MSSFPATQNMRPTSFFIDDLLGKPKTPLYRGEAAAPGVMLSLPRIPLVDYPYPYLPNPALLAQSALHQALISRPQGSETGAYFMPPTPGKHSFQKNYLNN